MYITCQQRGLHDPRVVYSILYSQQISFIINMSDAGYPSWLPKRPPPPAPQSTFQSSLGPSPPRATDVFGSTGRKATPRSVRIVARHVPWREREPTGDSAETRVHQPSQRRPRPRFRAPSLHLALLRSPGSAMRIRYFFHPIFMFAHLVVQTYFDFNVVFMLLQCVPNTSLSSRLMKPPLCQIFIPPRSN